MSYAPGAERSVESHSILDGVYPLMESSISSLYEYGVEAPSGIDGRSSAEGAFGISGVIETVVGDAAIQYRYEPVNEAIPPRVNRLSAYKDINRNRENFRRLSSVTLKNEENGAQLELMDLVPSGHRAFIKTGPYQGNSHLIPWENTIMLDCDPHSPLTPLYFLQSIGHAVKRRERPDWYAVYTNPVDMALATTAEFGGRTLYLRRMAWEFALEHFDEFMEDDPTAIYDRQRIRAFMGADLKRCRDMIENEMTHPFKTTLRGVGQAALLRMAQSQSGMFLDVQTTPAEEAATARIFGLERG